MPPENAKYLTRLNSGFVGRELWLGNAAEFEGIAVARGGALAFTSRPVDPAYMTACANGGLEALIKSRGERPPTDEQETKAEPKQDPETRLARLTRLRASNYQNAIEKVRANWQSAED